MADFAPGDKMIHTHSKWERCDFKCPVFNVRFSVWNGKIEAHYPDSVKRDIVINGVTFKQ